MEGELEIVVTAAILSGGPPLQMRRNHPVAGGYAKSRCAGPLRHFAPAANSGAASETTRSAEQHRKPHYVRYAFCVKKAQLPRSTSAATGRVRAMAANDAPTVERPHSPMALGHTGTYPDAGVRELRRFPTTISGRVPLPARHP